MQLSAALPVEEAFAALHKSWSGVPSLASASHFLRALEVRRASATEQEVHAGALASPDAADHVFAFFRTIPDATRSRKRQRFHRPDARRSGIERQIFLGNVIFLIKTRQEVELTESLKPLSNP